VLDVTFANQCERFDPGEGGPFTIGIVGRLPPGIQPVESLFGFAESSSVFAVHVEAISAPINLRSAEFEEKDEAGFQACGMNVLFKACHCAVGAGRNFCDVDTWLHKNSPCLCLVQELMSTS